MRQHLVTIFIVFSLTVPSTDLSFARSINIISAVYGTPLNNKTCDATAAVANICEGRSQCDVQIGNDTLCQDPNFLTVKQAEIKFRCGRHIRMMAAGEYTVARLNCH